MKAPTAAKTVGELRSFEYPYRSVKDEMRHNLIEKLRSKEPIFPGIVGYEDTVIPQVTNAIIAGHDIILLGERGQAKSRIMRSLIGLLDEKIPIIEGCEINDHPYQPICKRCRDLLTKMGDDTPIEWIGPDRRYGEKLATPDVTIADLIGEVDPIKVAEGRYLSDELTIHYGLIPRTNRGIFAINELPDLAEKIQVGLLNVMEEKDVQIRGYKIRLPLDIFIVASANPEDYTSRGRIITPLKDRFGAQIRTHYPSTIDEEIEIMLNEGFVDKTISDVRVPKFMLEIVAELSHLARRSPHVSQHSGVSVRMSISNYETLVACAIKRASQLGEKLAVPRICDLYYLIASTLGKIELDSIEEGREEQIVDRLLKTAVHNIFQKYFSGYRFTDLIQKFESGLTVETGESMPSQAYQKYITLPDIPGALQRLNCTPSNVEIAASCIEFVLEGLHLDKKLNKEQLANKVTYRR